VAGDGYQRRTTEMAVHRLRIAASGSSRPCWPRSSTGRSRPRARCAIRCLSAFGRICNRRCAFAQMKEDADSSGGPAAVRKPSVGPDQAAQGEQSTTWLQARLYPKRTAVSIVPGIGTKPRNGYRQIAPAATAPDLVPDAAAAPGVRRSKPDRACRHSRRRAGI
jgi:hypothetical protein